MQYHSFDVKIAEKLGVHKAILLQYIEFWVEKNAANDMCMYEGKAWVYHTAEAFVQIFPYMSKHQVWRALRELQEENYINACINIEKGKNRNQSTKYYTLTDFYYELKIESQSCKNASQSCKNATPNISYKINSKKVLKHTNTQTRENLFTQQQEQNEATFEKQKTEKNDKELFFEKIWAIYPRKINKKQAYKAFKKVKLEHYPSLEKSILAYTKSQWAQNIAKGRLEYIPYLSTFLNQERWFDNLSPTNELSPLKPLQGAEAILAKVMGEAQC